VLRYAAEKVTGKPLAKVDFEEVRGESGLREAAVEWDGQKIRLAIVHGLRNARAVAEQAKAGNCHYDLIEVMACPGGCVGGAGQPVSSHNGKTRGMRARGLYHIDKNLQLHKSQDNVFITECYTKFLGEPGKGKAHELLHTEYQSRRRLPSDTLPVLSGQGAKKIPVTVCLGTSCFLRGSEKVLRGLVHEAEEEGFENSVDIRASFCFEQCDRGPTVTVDGERLERCTLESAREALEQAFEKSRGNNGSNGNGNH